MIVKMYGGTAVGRVRKTNQDSIFYDEKAMVGVVADGIGGRRGGEIASGIVVKEFSRFLRREKGAPTADHAPEIYAALIEDINYRIFSLGERYKNISGMGTTTTALQFTDGRVFIPHCGDSRAYLFAHDHLFQLTIDHNIASSVKHGWLDPRSVPSKVKKDVLTRGVGLARYIETDVYQLPVSAGQIFLLCSDGLTDMVDDHRILKIIRTNRKSLRLLPDLLIQEACVRGGRDNVTVLVAKVIVK